MAEHARTPGDDAEIVNPPRRAPALIAHRDYMAIRGLVPVLKDRNHVAGPAIERIVASYEGLRDGRFIVVQECELTRAASVGAPEPHGSLPRRRWWRRGR